jgi:hypothetical protein
MVATAKNCLYRTMKKEFDNGHSRDVLVGGGLAGPPAKRLLALVSGLPRRFREREEEGEANKVPEPLLGVASEGEQGSSPGATRM